jgi:SAM-dependent methyltransferase
MPDTEVLEQMRADWNGRAREDARYYVAFGRRGQEEEEFLASAADVVRLLEEELKRLPRDIPPEARRGLEVGCGPGRLLRPMSRNFGELHGVDISDEMIRMAEERFRGASRIQLHTTNGSDLSPVASGYFDFVYSYAVFQHIPSRDVVLAYFAEIRRVLKNGGIARLQLNGLPPGGKAPNTWEGVRFSREEVADYARDHDFQLLALQGAGTQYMWTTWRKQPDGWIASLKSEATSVAVEGMGNAYTGEPLVPASGRFAYVLIRLAGLPRDFDLNHVTVTIDGAAGEPCYLGAPLWDGICQLNVLFPKDVRTGMVPLEIAWLGKPLCPPAWVRVIPPGPIVPRVVSVSDATNLLAGTRIESRTVKCVMEDLAAAEAVSVAVDGLPAEDLDWFETDALTGRFEINFRLPAELAAGAHQIQLCQGSRRFPPVGIEVV